MQIVSLGWNVKSYFLKILRKILSACQLLRVGLEFNNPVNTIKVKLSQVEPVSLPNYTSLGQT